MNPWDIEDQIQSGAEQAVAMGLVSPEDAGVRVQSALQMPSVVNLQGQKSQKQDTSKYQRNTQRKTLPSYDELHAQMLMAQGIKPGVKLNEQGQEMYEQATNNLGQPIYALPSGETSFENLPGATPLYDKSLPIFDFSRNVADPLHPVQQQMRGIDQMENLLAMQAGALGNRGVASAIDLSPIAALADYENQKQGLNTNLAKSYTPPPSPELMQEKLFARQQQIQKDRADLQKAIAQNVGLQNRSGGTLADLLAMTQMNQQNQSSQDAMNIGAQKAQSFEDRQVQRIHAQMVSQAKRDPILKAYMGQYSNLNNAISNLANADHMTPQQFDEAQQAVRANLGIKGTSGVNERDKTMLSSLGYNVDRLLQFATAKPSDIAQNDPIVQHIKQLAALEQNNINAQAERRIGAVLQGNDWIYNDPRYSYLKDSLLPFKQSLSGQYQNTPLMNQAVAKGHAYSNKNPTAPPRAADAVDVISPDGQEGTMSRANYERAIKAGVKFKLKRK